MGPSPHQPRHNVATVRAASDLHRHMQIRWRRTVGAELTWGVMGLFTGPHQTSCSEPGSRTMRLSRGERPVLAPENAVKAPVDVMAEPVS